MFRLTHLCCAGALLLSGGGANRPSADERQTTLRGASGAGEFSDASVTSLVQTRSKTRRMMTRDPEQLETWKDSGQAVDVDATTGTALMEMGHGITAEAFGAELHDLCDGRANKLQTRFVGTDENVQMSQKLKDKFNAMELDTRIEDLEATDPVQKYLGQSGTRKLGGNVIGLMEGTDLKHETIVVGAHYDSVNWEKTTEKAPGVDDNGSGTALVQLVARSMYNAKKSGVHPRRSVMFVGFNAEEEGLVGSEQMAAKVAAEGKNGAYGDVKAVLIADEVAYPGSGKGSRKAIFETLGDVPGASSLVDTFAYHAKKLNGENGTDGLHGFEVNNHGFGSDHIPFLKAKIPSMLLIERNNIAHSDTWGHSERDDFDHVDMEYGAAMARLMLHAATALSSPARAGPSAAAMLLEKSVARHSP